ncbi:hypothetical protein PTKIN_Ptkin01aG0277100 [Pterospermum kingtungense]
MPSSCSACHVFGHSDKICPKKVIVQQQWVPKKSVEKVQSSMKEEQVPERIEATPIAQQVGVSLDKCCASVDAAVSGNTSLVQDRSKGSMLNNKAASVNKYNALSKLKDKEVDYVDDELIEDIPDVVISNESRKDRASKAGVAAVLQSLKVPKKGPVDRGKKKQKASNSSSSS